jgi:hypothetical protein
MRPQPVLAIGTERRSNARSEKQAFHAWFHRSGVAIARANVFATAIFAEISTGFAPQTEVKSAPLHAMSGRSRNCQPIAERILGGRPFESLISTTFKALQIGPLNVWPAPEAFCEPSELI